MTHKASRSCSCSICLDVRGAVLLFLGGTGLIYSARERLLLAQVVKILSVQHLRPLPLPVDLEAGAILAVEFTLPVVLLVPMQRTIERVSIQRRGGSYLGRVFGFLSAHRHDSVTKSRDRRRSRTHTVCYNTQRRLQCQVATSSYWFVIDLRKHACPGRSLLFLCTAS